MYNTTAPTFVKIQGQTLDRFGKPLFGTKIIVSDATGKPLPYNGQNIGAISDNQGRYNIDMPLIQEPCNNAPCPTQRFSNFLIARSSGYNDVITQIENGMEKKTNIVFGIDQSATQELDEIVVTAPPKNTETTSLTPGNEETWFQKHRAAVIASIIGLFLLAIILLAITMSGSKAK